MSIRIELKKGFRHAEVAEWMNKHIGPIKEDVTWFWSVGDFYEEPSPYYPNLTLQKVKPEGVRIWKTDSKFIPFAILKWGS